MKQTHRPIGNGNSNWSIGSNDFRNLQIINHTHQGKCEIPNCELIFAEMWLTILGVRKSLPQIDV